MLLVLHDVGDMSDMGDAGVVGVSGVLISYFDFGIGICW